MESPFATSSETRSPERDATHRPPGRRRPKRRAALLAGWLFVGLAIGCERAGDPTARAEIGGADGTVSAERLEERLAEIRRLGDDLARADAIASTVRAVDAHGASILRREIVDRSSTWRPFDRLLLLSAWARFQGPEATRWATHSAPKPYRAIAIELAMTGWASRDPEAALAALLRDHAADGAATAGLIAGWLEADREGLRAYVEQLDLSDDVGQQAVAVYVRRLIEREGPAAAVAWAEARASDWNARRARHLYRQVASELTMADPAEGVAFCDRHCEGESGGAVRQMVATRWSHRDPAATMRWLVAAENADPDERRYAVNAGFGNWMRSAPRAAIDWAVSQDPSLREAPWFEPVVRRVARSLGWQRAAEALEWAESIARASERERAQIFILRRWHARDPAGADRWIDASTLSEEARHAVRVETDAQPGA